MKKSKNKNIIYNVINNTIKIPQLEEKKIKSKENTELNRFQKQNKSQSNDFLLAGNRNLRAYLTTTPFQQTDNLNTEFMREKNKQLAIENKSVEEKRNEGRISTPNIRPQIAYEPISAINELRDLMKQQEIRQNDINMQGMKYIQNLSSRFDSIEPPMQFNTVPTSTGSDTFIREGNIKPDISVNDSVTQSPELNYSDFISSPPPISEDNPNSSEFKTSMKSLTFDNSGGGGGGGSIDEEDEKINFSKLDELSSEALLSIRENIKYIHTKSRQGFYKIANNGNELEIKTLLETLNKNNSLRIPKILTLKDVKPPKLKSSKLKLSK